MIRKEWIAPNQIYVHGVLNNRELNQNYIGDLAQSMQDKGFLPEFPIDVFSSENIVNIDTDLPYICACGAHRTLGAISAKLERVLVHVHDGREEAFIEMMHLDNFKFDPAVNTGIGQPFTQKEKRAAVTQLLLLPKFFEQTNTALEEAWRIPNSSIRRWRNEVVELLEKDSPKLQLWGISDGRLARLRELAASSERKDVEGKVVKIRKPLVEATEDEKCAFYEEIEKDWYRLSDERALDTKFEHVVTWLQQKHNTPSKWRVYQDLSMTQLRNFHNLILSADADFMAAVFDIAQAENRVNAARESLQKASEACKKAFDRTLGKGLGEYDERYTGMRDRLETFLRKHDERFIGFRMQYFYYGMDSRDNPEFCEKYAVLHLEVKEALETDAEWIQAFTEQEKARLSRKRKKVVKDWMAALAHLREAIEVYPRDITQDAITAAVEHKFNYELKHNEFRDLITTEASSERKHLETIEKEANLFKKVAMALYADEDWIQEIEEPKPLVDVIVEAEDENASESEAPVFSIQPNDLHSLSLNKIFEHVKHRLLYIPVEDESEVRTELAQVLGKASRGLTGTQLYLLMDYALFISPKEDEEGIVIEKGGEEVPE